MKKIPLILFYISLLIIWISLLYLINWGIYLKSSFNNKYENETKNNKSHNKTNDLIGISFPPIKNETELNFTLSKLNELKIDKIRFETKWENRETKKNNFNWWPLDERIDFLYKNNISILLTINFDNLKYGDKNQFKNFIKTLAKRYSNKIDKIQYGNEWDYNHKKNIKDFVEYNNILYEEFHQYSTKTEVVLGWITRSSLIYEELCIKNTILDFSKLNLINWKNTNNLQNYLKKDLCISKKYIWRNI